MAWSGGGFGSTGVRGTVDWFLHYGHKEAFAAGGTGDEAVAGIGGVDAGLQAPGGVNGDSYGDGSQGVDEVMELSFIFFARVGACAIYEISARGYGIPECADDGVLPGGALVDECGRPLLDGFRVFAHHSFAGAGYVGGYDVEACAKRGKATDVALGDARERVAPFGEVFAEDVGPGGYVFVGYDYGTSR